MSEFNEEKKKRIEKIKKMKLEEKAREERVKKLQIKRASKPKPLSDKEKKQRNEMLKEKRLRESEVESLKAMNNDIQMTEKNKKIREKFESKSRPQIGSSVENKVWEQKRKNRYTKKVWKGWRESENKK